MTCNVPPFASAVLAEATRLAPRRRGAPGITTPGQSSDGVCADARHYATGGDHVPSGPHMYAHAVDVSQSIPGAPFWDPKYDRFDVHALARQQVQAYYAGHWDWRIKFVVIGQPNGPDIIFNPLVILPGERVPRWRQNGPYQTEHRSHAHYSFTVAAEQSTAPFFREAPVTQAEIAAVARATRDAIFADPRFASRVQAAAEDAIAGKFSTVHQDGTEVPNGLIFKLRTFFK